MDRLVALGAPLGEVAVSSGAAAFMPFECTDCESTLAPGSPVPRVYIADTSNLHSLFVPSTSAESSPILWLKRAPVGDICLPCFLLRARFSHFGPQLTVDKIVSKLGLAECLGLGSDSGWMCSEAALLPPSDAAALFLDEDDVRPLVQATLLGLDGVGKTTLLRQLLKGDDLDRAVFNLDAGDEVACNTETVGPRWSPVRLQVRDVTGQEAMREQWRDHISDTQVIMFMVAATDDEARLTDAKLHMQAILQHERLSRVPLILLVNKTGGPGARGVTAVAESMELRSISNRQWHLQGIDARTGDGFDDCTQWIAHTLRFPQN